MIETDWMWVYENPKDAAKKIDRLRTALDEACQIALGTDLHREAAERIGELCAAANGF